MQKTLAKINLSAIRSNAVRLKNLAGGRKLFAVVKADAYGHGAVAVARALSDIADCLCVAIVDEGVELRAAGISAPVLVFTPPVDVDDAVRMSAYGLIATVVDGRTACLCRGLDVHIKINTGMNRYGCPPDGLPGLLQQLEESRVCGVYSHIYAPLSHESTAGQLKYFRRCADIVRARHSSAVAHFAATAGIYLGGSYLFDAVRPGIGLYGYAPAGFRDEELKPALALFARRVQTNCPTFGGGAGYGEAEEEYPYLSTYRAGYADGLARTCPLGVGALCMDSFVSRSRDDELCIMSDADDYAARLGTNSYEVLCAVTKRSLRIYEG